MNVSMNKNFFKHYKERYYIEPLDLADFGETNRLHILIASPFVFAIGVLDLIVIFSLHFHNLRDYIPSIIYFGIFTLSGILMFLWSQWTKNVDRQKAYIIKTIPAYIFLYIGLFAGVYNFHLLGQPFNGVLSYCIAGFVALLAFDFSPLFYSLAVILGLAFLIPGVYKNFGVTGLMDTILAALLMYLFSLYKRFVEKQYILMLKKQKQNLEAKTFGNFTLLYNNKVIKFNRSKSPELLAYLIYKNGSSVQSKELISVLWGDHADSSQYGANLRNLISDISHSLSELEIQNFFIREYNNLRINPEVINCDYYDFLAGDEKAVKSFAGEFMSQYSWAEEAAAFIEQKIQLAHRSK